MKKTALTLFCPVGNNKRIMINNGMSFGIELLEPISHFFFDINKDVQTLKESLSNSDEIYISMYSTTELNFIKEIIDSRWIIGGPIVTTLNKYGIDLPCETTTKTIAEYVGVDDYRPIQFSDYFEKIMIAYPNSSGDITLSIGGQCYWGKCRFCSFVSDREMMYGKDIERIIEQSNSLKHDYMIHTAVPAIEPSQLKTILGCYRKNKYGIYVIPSKEITEVLRDFDNNEMKGIVAIVGLEALSNRNRALFRKGTNDRHILECIDNIVRLGGTLDIPLMTGFFNTTKSDVIKSQMFMKEMERIIPRDQVSCFIWNDNIYTRWPLNQRKFLESVTEFPIVEEHDGFINYLKVQIPEDSDVYAYNEQIKNIVGSSSLCTNPNESPKNILDEEFNI